MTRYHFTLPGGEHVTGAVLGRDGFLGPGQVGAIRCDLVHAELGLPLVNLQESASGHAILADLDRKLLRLVPLAGAQVSPA